MNEHDDSILIGLLQLPCSAQHIFWHLAASGESLTRAQLEERAEVSRRSFFRSAQLLVAADLVSAEAVDARGTKRYTALFQVALRPVPKLAHVPKLAPVPPIGVNYYKARSTSSRSASTRLAGVARTDARAREASVGQRAVAAYLDERARMGKPPVHALGRVGSLAKSLVREGYRVEVVEEAARELAQRSFVSVGYIKTLADMVDAKRREVTL